MKFRSTPAFKLLSGFVIGAFLLSGAAALAISGGLDYLKAGAAIERLQQGARASSDARNALAAMEQRAQEHLLSGDDDALKRYRQSAAAIDPALALVRGAIAQEPDAQPAFSSLQRVIRARRAELDGVVDARARADPPSRDAIPAAQAGDQAFAGFDARIADRHATEIALRRDSQTTMQRGIWLIVAVLIMLFSAAYALVLAELRERRRLSRRLRQAATHDPLTGLPNRRFFGEWLGYSIAHARREERQVGLLFVDVEGPQQVAQLHGRPVANSLLLEVARRFRETAREGDLLARVGTSQFALATPILGAASELGALAQRLRDALGDPARPPLADVPIEASIGIAYFPDDAGDPAGVMAAADAAMSAAKRAGSNRVAYKPLAEAA